MAATRTKKAYAQRAVNGAFGSPVDANGFSEKDFQGDSGSLESACRLVEAVIFAAPAPVPEIAIAALLPSGVRLEAVMDALKAFYDTRGPDLERVNGCWQFSCARMLAMLPGAVRFYVKPMTPAAMSVLAHIAYGQPISLDMIEQRRRAKTRPAILRRLEADGWIRQAGRLQEPGRPIAWVTTEAFLERFDLDSLDDLPTPDEAREVLQAEAPRAQASETALDLPFRWISAGSPKA